MMLSIREACDRYGLTPRTLRFWEQSELISSQRRERGHRRYSAGAIYRIETIIALKALGLSLEEIRQALHREPPAIPAERLRTALKEAQAEAHAANDRRMRLSLLLLTANPDGHVPVFRALPQGGTSDAA